MVNWNLKLSQEAFFQSDNSYFEITHTLLGSCIEMLDLTNSLLTFFCWVELFDAKILLLLLRNNELTWAKSIKLISCCNEEWLELNSFFKTLISDFLWRISSCNNFTWYCLYVKEALREWLLTLKLKKLRMTLLSLYRNRNSKCSLLQCYYRKRFERFRF